MIPTPLDVLRVLPRCGMQLLIPAMGCGAVAGSLLDLLFGHDGYPLAMAGVIVGPVLFGFAINVLERAEAAFRDDEAAAMEAYRLAETEKRRAAAERRGELVKLDEHRAPKR
ncbi:hypothetical protein [Jannaschia seohaensis]|uniref:Uncharacterized protein n=1 Tax=Jannaschia seohaensis TaxID=475081 RepID=A0A2Y9C5G2_9RHOB|nr:hypothetical protein [Jannaschia seohaensis]PWJ20853.1 hypothetical protein BCF38_10299 [Jannaschia seohaensis]SSA41263.1 hypothetical protein SAMN05421539_10299 [Jannaschia seohaensis]